MVKRAEFRGDSSRAALSSLRHERAAPGGGSAALSPRADALKAATKGAPHSPSCAPASFDGTTTPRAPEPNAQQYVKQVLGRWMTAPDGIVGCAKELLKEAWGLPDDIDLRFYSSPRRPESAVQTAADGSIFARGELRLPEASIPFELLLRDERQQDRFVALMCRDLDKKVRTPLSPVDRSLIEEIARMTPQRRERFYAASDCFDAWRQSHRSADLEVVFSGYQDDFVAVVARHRDRPGLDLFTARVKPDKTFELLRPVSAEVSVDPVTAKYCFNLEGGASLKGNAGLGATYRGVSLLPLPSFLLEEPRK